MSRGVPNGTSGAKLSTSINYVNYGLLLTTMHRSWVSDCDKQQSNPDMNKGGG